MVDESVDALAILNRRAVEAGVAAAVTWIQADAEALTGEVAERAGTGPPPSPGEWAPEAQAGRWARAEGARTPQAGPPGLTNRTDPPEAEAGRG